MTCKTCGGDAKDRDFCEACLAESNPYEGPMGHSSVRSKGPTSFSTPLIKLGEWDAPPDLPTMLELKGVGVIKRFDGGMLNE